MSQVYAPAPVLHGQYVLPSDGDPAVAQSVNTPFRDLADTSVYIIGQLEFLIDVRGSTRTLTGNVVLQGASNWYQGVDTFFTDDVTHGATGALNGHVVSIYDELRVRGDANLRGQVTIGSGPNQSLEVLSTTDFANEVTFRDNVQLGNTSNDTITIGGALNVTEPADFSEAVTIDGNLTVNHPTVIASTLHTTQAATLGNSSNDAHVVTGTLAVTGDVTLQSQLFVSSDAQVDGDVEMNGDTVVNTFRTRGDTRIGNSSSDELTLDATLISVVAFSGAGRVPLRVAQLPDTNFALEPADGNLFWAGGSGTPNPITATRTYTVGNVAVTGDCVEFQNESATYSIIVGFNDPNGTPRTVTVNAGNNWKMTRVNALGWIGKEY